MHDYASAKNVTVEKARMQAHSKFDMMWRSGVLTRDEAYKWLKVAMDMTALEAHMGSMDVNQCYRVMQLVDGWVLQNGYTYEMLSRMELDRIWDHIDNL